MKKMPELHETVERKFIESFDVDEWEIETDTGFSEISQIHKTIPYKIWEIETENNLKLKCADTHIIFDEYMNEVFVKDLQINQYIQTKFGISKIIKITETEEFDNMYDVSLNDENHRFYSNGILSHNSVTTAAYILWFILFNPNKTVAIMANKAPLAREILSRITLSLENIPFFLQPGVKTLNKGSIEFGNNSKIIASAADRGFSVDLLYLDEFAFVENAEEFFKAMFPTISSSTSTKVFISSTPNGLNLFYRLWKNAQEGKNDFTPVEITWKQVPGRDEKWKKEQIEVIGEDGFRQEYGNEFLGSNKTLLAAYKLKELAAEIPIITDKENIILEKPKENSSYMCIVDVARGTSNDYSTITVIDITSVPYKTVYIYRSNDVRSINFSGIISNIGKMYNNALIAIERNGMGLSVAESVSVDYEYENLFSTQNGGRKGQILSLGTGKKKLLGIDMSGSVKRIGCAILKALVEENKLIQFTEEQIQEFYHFVEKGNSFEAEKNHHDDLIMPLVLFSWIVNTQFFQDYTNKNLINIFDDNSEEFEKSENMFFHTDGTEENDITILDDTLDFFGFSPEQIEMLKNFGK